MRNHKRARPVFFPSCLVLLFLGIAFSPVAAAQAGEEPKTDFNTLERRLFEAYREGDYPKALEIAEKMHQLNPRHADTVFNIAILYSLLGHKDLAYQWLEKAVDTGGLRSFRQAYFERYIAMLEHEDRDGFQKPDQVMAALALKPGERVADIGAGSGYFTTRIAKAVGPKGIVWALDIEPAMLDYIKKRLDAEKLQNVRLNLVPVDDPQLPAGGVDTILLVHTYAYIENRSDYLGKLRAALAPEGRVVIIEYIPASWTERPWGPAPHQQVSMETTDAEMAAAGFKPIKVHDFLPLQYFVQYAVK